MSGLCLSLSGVEPPLPLRSLSTRSLILGHPNHLIPPALPPLRLSLAAFLLSRITTKPTTLSLTFVIDGFCDWRCETCGAYK
ncbi:hypothetical protein EYF80_045641 [Liparis tanakae]|uniref:Uncharacterized protein n=1 Tax=Liparis tanakae TaxID=230148 RepID=A0A4Z2FT21_9TELE|nr:hypothetical protein EYF80_045641 [Liparis tanakae]